MRRLKKKKLGIIEVYFLFTICMITGYFGYLTIINQIIY